MYKLQERSLQGSLGPVREIDSFPEFYEFLQAQQRPIKCSPAFFRSIPKNDQKKLKTRISPLFMEGDPDSRLLLVLDIDNTDKDIIDLTEPLWGFSYILYTTISHSPESPKYRLILPLDKAVNRSEYKALNLYAHQLLGITERDNTGNRVTQGYFYPTKWQEDPEEEASFFLNTGKNIPVLDWLNLCPPEVEIVHPVESLLETETKVKPWFKPDFVGMINLMDWHCPGCLFDEFLKDYITRVGKTNDYKENDSHNPPGIKLNMETGEWKDYHNNPAFGEKERSAFDVVRIFKFPDLVNNFVEGSRATKELIVEQKRVNREIPTLWERYWGWVKHIQIPGRDQKPRIKLNEDVVATIYANHPALRETFLFNTRSGALECNVKNKFFNWSKPQAVKDAVLETKRVLAQFTSCTVGGFVTLSNASQFKYRVYDPFKEEIEETLKIYPRTDWDYKDYIENYLSTRYHTDPNDNPKFVEWVMELVKAAFTEDLDANLSRSCLALIGPPKSGKSTLVNLFPHVYNANPSILGTSHFIRSFLHHPICLFDDVGTLGMDWFNRLKSLITNPTQTPEYKYENETPDITVRAKIAITSNDDIILPSGEGADRFSFIQFPNNNFKHISDAGKRELKKEAYKLLAAAKYLLEDGYSIDLSRFIDYKRYVITDYAEILDRAIRFRFPATTRGNENIDNYVEVFKKGLDRYVPGDGNLPVGAYQEFSASIHVVEKLVAAVYPNNRITTDLVRRHFKNRGFKDSELKKVYGAFGKERAYTSEVFDWGYESIPPPPEPVQKIRPPKVLQKKINLQTPPPEEEPEEMPF
jgi:hypothetical protein